MIQQYVPIIIQQYLVFTVNQDHFPLGGTLTIEGEEFSLFSLYAAAILIFSLSNVSVFCVNSVSSLFECRFSCSIIIYSNLSGFGIS